MILRHTIFDLIEHKCLIFYSCKGLVENSDAALTENVVSLVTQADMRWKPNKILCDICVLISNQDRQINEKLKPHYQICESVLWHSHAFYLNANVTDLEITKVIQTLHRRSSNGCGDQVIKVDHLTKAFTLPCLIKILYFYSIFLMFVKWSWNLYT